MSPHLSVDRSVLEGLLGRRVDLRTAADLSRHFRDEVVRTAEVQYARGCLTRRAGARRGKEEVP